jgi:hypothetical protein
MFSGPRQTQSSLGFNEVVQQLFSFGCTVGLHQSGLETRNIALQRDCLI